MSADSIPGTGSDQGLAPQAAAVSAETSRRFRLPIFEGPLDLLLHLIKRNELEVQEVTASVITEQYLQYLELLDSLNLDVAGEYLVMASTLLLIKSFALLPHPEIVDEDDEAESLRRELVARLLEFQRYREAAGKLAARALLGRDVFSAPGEALPEPDGDALSYRVTLFELVDAMREVLKRIADDMPRELELRDIPVALCIPRILGRLAGHERIEFVALFEDINDRALMVATFLALLELIRRREVRARQEVRFGPIWLERAAPAMQVPA